MKIINRGKKIAMIVVVLCICLLTVGIVYVSDYYRPTKNAMSALESDEFVEVSGLEEGVLVFKPAKTTSQGFIFYPGGKVAYESYAPLMRALAEQGILCVLPEMPCNLAVLDMDAAKGIAEQFPEITDWYLGGHSLGGSMAASYMAENTATYEGLILLASYSTVNIAECDVTVLSVYGSEDKVLDLEKYEKYRSNLPTDTIENIIEGGCHAFFGSYGVQDGDGVPTITEEEQLQKTVDFILEIL